MDEFNEFAVKIAKNTFYSAIAVLLLTGILFLFAFTNFAFYLAAFIVTAYVGVVFYGLFVFAKGKIYERFKFK